MDPNEDDLFLLDALKLAKPTLINDSDGIFYVVMNSLPREVLEAFNVLTQNLSFVLINQKQCLRESNWRSCRDLLMSELMTRMTKRSLELGIRGPMPGELDQSPILSVWFPVRDPDFGGAILIGVQSGHPTLRGNVINTSKLCGIDNDYAWARTATRWYKLGQLAEPKDVDLFRRGNASLASLPRLNFSEVQASIDADRVSAGSDV